MSIDVEQVSKILKQLKAFGKTKVPISDLAFYCKKNVNTIKGDINSLEGNFNVERLGKRTFISLK